MADPPPAAPDQDRRSWAPPSGPPLPAPPPGQHTGPSPGHREPRPPVDAEQLRRAGQLMTRFAVLVLAAVVASSLRLPWQAGALVFSVGAVVVGVAAVRAVVRARMGAVSAGFGVAGVALAALLAVANLVTVLFWPLHADLQRCQDRALSPAGERRCVVEYEDRVADMFGVPVRR